MANKEHSDTTTKTTETKQTDIEISHSDGFFTETEQKIIEQYCHDARYIYGEHDNPDSTVTGMTHDIPETEFVYKLIAKTLHDRAEFTRNMNLYRMYVNHFAPSEEANFHNDGEGYTFLYYPHTEEYDLDEGGETQFLLDGNIFGIRAISNRMAVFDGQIPHRATPFRTQHRFTIAIKYE